MNSSQPGPWESGKSSFSARAGRDAALDEEAK
jgi:hypothetical protein